MPMARLGGVSLVLLVPLLLPAGCAQANQRRAELVSRQARSSSITMLLSFTGRHEAADAAVEAQVRLIRQALELPPPKTS